MAVLRDEGVVDVSCSSGHSFLAFLLALGSIVVHVLLMESPRVCVDGIIGKSDPNQFFDTSSIPVALVVCNHKSQTWSETKHGSLQDRQVLTGKCGSNSM